MYETKQLGETKYSLRTENVERTLTKKNIVFVVKHISPTYGIDFNEIPDTKPSVKSIRRLPNRNHLLD